MSHSDWILSIQTFLSITFMEKSFCEIVRVDTILLQFFNSSFPYIWRGHVQKPRQAVSRTEPGVRFWHRWFHPEVNIPGVKTPLKSELSFSGGSGGSSLEGSRRSAWEAGVVFTGARLTLYVPISICRSVYQRDSLKRLSLVKKRPLECVPIWNRGGQESIIFEPVDQLF